MFLRENIKIKSIGSKIIQFLSRSRDNSIKKGAAFILIHVIGKIDKSRNYITN